MRIYEIKAEVEKYQWVIPNISDEDEDLLTVTFYNGTVKKKWRKDIDFYIYNPKRLKGNFYNIAGGSALIFDQEVYDSSLYALLELSGQIIPINCEGEKLYILNVLECVNMLDINKSKFELYSDGSLGDVLEFSFHEERISESSIFKIPQMNSSQVLTYTNVKDPYDEFKYLYEKLGFKGLVFEKIYSSL